MNDKQKLDVIKDVAYIQSEVSQRFFSLITKQISRKGLSLIDIEKFKESVAYVIDEKFTFVESKIRKYDSTFIKDIQKENNNALEILGYTSLRMGSPVWYVDYEESQIEKGTISEIYFNDGEIETFSVDFENGDFDEFTGESMGQYFFTSEEEANIAFVKGDKIDKESNDE